MVQELSLRILTSWGDVKAIGPEWDALHARCSRGPFDGFSHCALWWETLGDDGARTPHIVTARRNGILVGVLPLVVKRYYGVRFLKWAGKDLFDYNEALGETSAVVESLWSAALQSRAFDIAFLGGIRRHATETRALQKMALALDQNTTTHLPIPWTTREAWLLSQSSHHRRKTKSSRRALAQGGVLSHTVYRGPDAPRDAVRTMVQEKLAWYGTHKKNELFGHPRVYEVFDRLTATAAANGTLFMSELKVGDRPVAHALGFVVDKVLHLYCTSYDQAMAKGSPGRTLLEEVFGWCVDNGVREIDLMRGNEAYKHRYDPVIRTLPCYVYGRSLVGKALVFVYATHVGRILGTPWKFPQVKARHADALGDHESFGDAVIHGS